MSKSNPVIVAGRELTQEEAARRAGYPDDRLYGGIEAISDRVLELFNVKVTPNYIRDNIEVRKLRSRIIRHKVYCSDRDLYDFIILGNPAREAEGEVSA